MLFLTLIPQKNVENSKLPKATPASCPCQCSERKFVIAYSIGEKYKKVYEYM